MPRQLLRKVYSEDLASCEWEAVQVFQRKMTELQQRVARLLLAAACQHLRPEPERNSRTTMISRIPVFEAVLESLGLKS